MARISDCSHLCRKRLQTVTYRCNQYLSRIRCKLPMACACIPGMNHVVLILYLSKSFSRRGTPTSPAYIPCMMILSTASNSIKVYLKRTLEISPGESWPPYEPSLWICFCQCQCSIQRTLTILPASHSINVDTKPDKHFSRHLSARQFSGVVGVRLRAAHFCLSRWREK